MKSANWNGSEAYKSLYIMCLFTFVVLYWYCNKYFWLVSRKHGYNNFTEAKQKNVHCCRPSSNNLGIFVRVFKISQRPTQVTGYFRHLCGYFLWQSLVIYAFSQSIKGLKDVLTIKPFNNTSFKIYDKTKIKKKWSRNKQDRWFVVMLSTLKVTCILFTIMDLHIEILLITAGSYYTSLIKYNSKLNMH